MRPLVAIQTQSLSAAPTTRSATVFAKPRYVLQSVRLVGIHNLSDAMLHELTSMMDDPRLHGLSFPRIGIAKLHRATHATARALFNAVLRPKTGSLAPTPRLPQALTLQCSQSALNTGHLETFFQLLPFTQGIRALTLNGMGTHWQLWAWLGFALFHPNASTSSLRKLNFLRHTTCLEPRSLSLFVQAMHLRVASADEFAYIVESYAEELQANRGDGGETAFSADTVARVVEDHQATVHSAPIASVTIDLSFHSKSAPCKGIYWGEGEFDVTAWTLVLDSLSATLRQIYITPVHRHKASAFTIRLRLARAAVMRLVRQCPRLQSLSIPMELWTGLELTELLDTTRATLQSLEVHAKADQVDRVLHALAQAANSGGQYALRHVSLAVHQGQLPPNGQSWQLCEELLMRANKPAFCLEYLYVHMESLDSSMRTSVVDPIGEAPRRLKRFHGELLLHARAAETKRQAVALLTAGRCVWPPGRRGGRCDHGVGSATRVPPRHHRLAGLRQDPHRGRRGRRVWEQSASSSCPLGLWVSTSRRVTPCTHVGSGRRER